MKRYRKPLLFGTTGVAAVLVMVSTAFACTVWVGQMTVTGTSSRALPNPASSSGSVTAYGKNGVNGAGMEYCSAPSGTANVARTEAGVGLITVTVGKYICGSTNLGLPGPAANVNYLPNEFLDCMNPRGIPIGAMTLSNGSGTGTYAVPGVGNTTGGGLGDTSITGSAAICVAATGTIYANQAPIHII